MVCGIISDRLDTVNNILKNSAVSCQNSKYTNWQPLSHNSEKNPDKSRLYKQFRILS